MAGPLKYGRAKKRPKFTAIFDNFRLWSRISPEWLQISKMWKKCDRHRFTPRSRKKVRWTLVTNKKVFLARIEPPKWIFWGDYISAHRGCCALKILHALEIDQALIAHTRSGTGVPQEKFNRENLKFALKFSVLATITSELVGVSPRNIFHTTCRGTGVITWA